MKSHCAQGARSRARRSKDPRTWQVNRLRGYLPDLLLVAVLPQALLALVGGHLVALPLLTAGHVRSLLLVLQFDQEAVHPVDDGRVLCQCLVLRKTRDRLIGAVHCRIGAPQVEPDVGKARFVQVPHLLETCLLYTSDAADE